jgi:hypothetical protein
MPSTGRPRAIALRRDVATKPGCVLICTGVKCSATMP